MENIEQVFLIVYIETKDKAKVVVRQRGGAMWFSDQLCFQIEVVRETYGFSGGIYGEALEKWWPETVSAGDRGGRRSWFWCWEGHDYKMPV